ncbi:MAG: peptidyl-alpha-hydroxyglycine alpha-amidating lyase family protein [Dehalococcoidales bacterium]
MSFGSGKHTYELVDGWAKYPKDWSILDVGGIAIDKQDNVYVFNRGAHPLMVFDREGNMQSTWGEGIFKRAHGSCTDSEGNIYCTDDFNHTVRKFTSDGKLLMTLGTEDKPSDTGYINEFDFFASLVTITRGGGPFNRPTGVAVGPSGNIYIADGYGNAQVHKFSNDGKYLFSWGGPGTGPSQFRLPHNIWVDRQERVWIPDRENSRFQIFDSEGKLLDMWTDQLRPTDLFIDDEDTVYISDLADRVRICTIDGKLLSEWAAEGTVREKALFIAPHAIAVDSQGSIYVGEVAYTGFKIDKGPRAIQKFARKA